MSCMFDKKKQQNNLYIFSIRFRKGQVVFLQSAHASSKQEYSDCMCTMSCLARRQMENQFPQRRVVYCFHKGELFNIE